MRRLVSLLLLLVATTVAFGQGYVIERYDTTITLGKTDTMSVEERLQVLFQDTRRGIYRLIPRDYETGKAIGNRRVDIEGIEVTDDAGNRLTTKISTEGADLNIRIGDADVWLPAGSRKTYVIRYRATGMLNWFDHAENWNAPKSGGVVELYWNLIGDRWDTSILSSSFRVVFPAPVAKGVTRARVYAGPYGSRDYDEVDLGAPSSLGEQTGVALRITDQEVVGERTTPLGPYSALSLVLDLPEDSIAKPDATTIFLRILKANLGLTIPLWIGLLLFAAWLRYGRDPKAGPLVVTFEPPDNLTGSEAGTLLDEKVDTRDIVAGLVSLAVKGYLEFHPKETGLVFKKRSADIRLTGKAQDVDLSPFESDLLRHLQKGGDLITESDLRDTVAPNITSLKATLYQSLVDRGYYRGNPNSVRAAWIAGGVAVLVLMGFVSIAISPFSGVAPAVVGGIVGLILVIAFGMQMPKRTIEGALAHRRVQGFEEFVRRAKGKELDWAQRRQPDALMFEEYLPHAVAFGLVAQWASAFDGIVTEPPRWYVTPYGYGGPFYMHSFASDLNDIGSAVGSAAVTPPRSSGASGGSSGFGGGGFSGGGFGGGGGGSW
ncbi:MAG: DUF2207 domain-containing protein [Fimbriimonadaceae bacterium]|nr:DUF2207 domain-containing protein [Fimbriimonadaceae bacterium]